MDERETIAEQRILLARYDAGVARLRESLAESDRLIAMERTISHDLARNLMALAALHSPESAEEAALVDDLCAGARLVLDRGRSRG